MRRRTFITLLGGAAAAWPLAARAQPGEHMRRIGVLIALAEDDPEAKAWVAGFLQGLAKRGWSEDHNLHIDYRFPLVGAQAQVLAKELVALRPDVIFAMTTPAVAALQRESHEIPIVFAALADPVGSGFMASLSRPGGNITGVMQYEPTVTGKWLAMLKEIAPRLIRVAFMIKPKTAPFYNYYLGAAEPLSQSLGIELVPTFVENPTEISTAPSSRSRACRMAVCSCRRMLRPSPIAISSLHLRPGTVYRRSTHFVFSSWRVVSCPTESTLSTRVGRRHFMSTASCAATSRATFRCRRRPSLRPP
jgi:putative ABC transport system substrate-binding protein